MVLEALAREGVGRSALEVRNGALTPVCVCLSGEDGRTAFLWRIDESTEITAETLRTAGTPVLADADAVLITYETQGAAIDAIRLARAHDSLVVLQPAPPSSAVNANDVPWKSVDVLIPNEREAHALLHGLGYDVASVRREDLAYELSLATGVAVVIVTLGGDGLAAHGPGFSGHVPATPVDHVVDTTGASDAFTATFSRSVMLGHSLRAAIDLAQRAAGSVVGLRGAFDPIALDSSDHVHP